ncbi:MAG: hypothetical protein U1F06_00720 [Steroidobacteraceae bacterium]
MPKVRASSGTIGTMLRPIALFLEHVEDAHEGHRRGDLALAGAVQHRLEGRERRHGERRGQPARRAGR